MNKPRIFHLITRLLRGGAEAKTFTEFEGLRHKYDFTLGYGALFSSKQLKRLSKLKIPAQRFNLIRHYDPFSLSLSCFQLYRYLKANPFELVHTHSTEAGIVGRIAAHWAGVPCIVHTIHGIPFTDQRNPLLRQVLLILERWTATWTTRLIDNAQSIREIYLNAQVGCPEQYVTIHSGIDLKRFVEATPMELDISPNTFKVLMAARLVQGKGFEELLQAAQQVAREIPAIVFLVAGEGPLKSKLERQIRQKSLTRHIHLLGHQSNLAGLMKTVDLFVLPSYREGTPRVISEAMAAGLPIVATRIDGIPDQVIDGVNGKLIEPRQSAPLAEAIVKLAKDERLCLKMGQASQRRSQLFSQSAMLTALDELYQTLLINRTHSDLLVNMERS